MSFNEQVKSTLVKYETDDLTLQTAELYGFAAAGTSLLLKGRGELNIRIDCDYAFVAARVYALIKKVFAKSPKIGQAQFSSFGGRTSYFVLLNGTADVKEFLHYFNMMDAEGRFSSSSEIYGVFLQDTESRTAFLRGVFLACGYVADPSKSLQMQFSFKNSDFAESFIKYLKDFDVISKSRSKKNDTIVYIKRSDDIADILAYIGAHRDNLVFQDRLAMRQMKNRMQRKVNCETANINKTTKSAFTQTQAIEKIIKLRGLSMLSEPLIEAAQLRLDNPYASLSELAQSVNPPISRSTLDKRFRRILEIADSLF